MSWTNVGAVATWLLMAVAVTACVEGRRQQSDAAGDTSSQDTADDTDDGTVTNEIEPEDTVEPEVDIAECDTFLDCVPETANACVEYACVDRKCVETKLDDTSCSDGDVCTPDDRCKHGVCEPGDPLECEGDIQCWPGLQAECDPTGGCGGVFEPRGTACYDTEGPEPGTCVKGWRVPADRCDGLGQCQDQSGTLPRSNHPLGGTWLFVVESAPIGAAPMTLRAMMLLDKEGGLSLNDVSTSGPTIAGLESGAVGTYCAALTGEIRLEIGPMRLKAWVDASNQTMVFGDADVDSSEQVHGMAIRATGSPSGVTGTYRLVSTAAYASTTPQLMTWQGHIGFTGGCITGAGEISTGGGLGTTHSYATSGADCFQSTNGGHLIQAKLIPAGATGGEATVAVQWTGAIGARGEILLLTRDDGGLRPGIIVLVRDPPVERANLSGEFSFVSLAGGISDASTPLASITPRLEIGAISYLDDAEVEGSLDTGALVGPGWWFTATAGSRYAHRIIIDEHVVEHSGWVSRDDNFIMGWRVAPPQLVSVPQLLSLTPTEGSLFLAVRPLVFATTPR